MTLEEWSKLTDEEKGAILMKDNATYLALAQEAAKRFLEEGHLNASSVYLVDRFGELMLQVYVPNGKYDGFGSGWEHVIEEYFGFRFMVEAERNMYEGLDEYAGEFFFER